MSRLRTLVAGAALAAAATLFMAAPAAAHDELVASDPKAGDDFATAPAEVSLTFTGDVMTVGALVVVADQSGKDWVSGEPEILAGTVVVPLETSLPDAGYELRWRVVSSDGHPISGLIPFTVGGAAPLERAPVESPAPVVPDTAAQAPPSAEMPGFVRGALLGLGGAIVALAIWAVARFFLRRSRGTSVSSETTSNTARKAQS